MSSTYIPASVRRLVRERSYDCCEYSLTPENTVLLSHEVDHIVAEKHGGLTQAENLALSCAVCNKYKGSDIASIHPDTDEVIRLYHPRRDSWSDHFQLQNSEIIPLTPIGLVTARLLKFNQHERVEERKSLIESDLLQIRD